MFRQLSSAGSRTSRSWRGRFCPIGQPIFSTYSPSILCKDRKEVDAHAKRLLAAQVISVCCFLLFPLQYAFAQPKTTGVFGWLFHALGNFDRPFNQAPSLHLSLTTILWAKYSEHVSGFKLFLLKCWFVLVGLSTLTTYQHHFIDLPAGIWVGLFCIVLFPTEKS